MRPSQRLEEVPLGGERGFFQGGLQPAGMPHPKTLSAAQQKHLTALCRRYSVRRVAIELGMNREVVTRLCSGLDCHAGTIALALANLPKLDAALDATSTPNRAA